MVIYCRTISMTWVVFILFLLGVSPSAPAFVPTCEQAFRIKGIEVIGIGFGHTDKLKDGRGREKEAREKLIEGARQGKWIVALEGVLKGAREIVTWDPAKKSFIVETDVPRNAIGLEAPLEYALGGILYSFHNVTTRPNGSETPSIVASLFRQFRSNSYYREALTRLREENKVPEQFSNWIERVQTADPKELVEILNQIVEVAEKRLKELRLAGFIRDLGNSMLDIASYEHAAVFREYLEIPFRFIPRAYPDHFPFLRIDLFLTKRDPIFEKGVTEAKALARERGVSKVIIPVGANHLDALERISGVQVIYTVEREVVWSGIEVPATDPLPSSSR